MHGHYVASCNVSVIYTDVWPVHLYCYRDVPSMPVHMAGARHYTAVFTKSPALTDHI